MYGYRESFIPLTKEEILKRVSQEEIFEMVFKQKIVVDKDYLYTAPYRNDTKPGCWFDYYDNTLRFIDFGDNKYGHLKDCFNIVGVTYNLSYRETLEYINEYFKLGLELSNSNNGLVVPEKYSYNKEANTDFFKNTFLKPIQVYYRDWEIRDKEYWSKYGISKLNLDNDKVKPVKYIRILNKYNEYFTIQPFDLTYAYTNFNNSKVKVYRPYHKEFKWLSNLTSDDIGNSNSVYKLNLKEFPREDNILIISKSYKDFRVLSNLLRDFNSKSLFVIWFQNETCIPNINLLTLLTKKFGKILVFYDNDEAGKLGSLRVSKELNTIFPNISKSINLDNNLPKDPADLYLKLGEEKTKKIITDLITNNLK